MESTAVESLDMRAPADAGARGGTSSPQSQRAVGDNRRGQEAVFHRQVPAAVLRRLCTMQAVGRGIRRQGFFATNRATREGSQDRAC